MDIIAVAANKAPLTLPPVKEVKNTHNCPVGACPEPNAISPNEFKGENVLMNIWEETPAAINKDTPEPNPHLLVTSSIYNTIIPPRNN